MKEGFTLIELLAVIVILAIIATIAIPIVLNIIDDVKVSNIQLTMESIERAAELYYYKNSTTNNFEKIIFNCDGDKCSSGSSKLELTGEIPELGIIQIEKRGEVSLKSVLMNGYNCVKENQKYECIKPNINKIDTTKNFFTINDNKLVYLVNYRIYGKSIQNRVPSMNNPIEIENVGDPVIDENDPNYGKYKIDMKVTNDLLDDEVTTIYSIYLEEPLRCINNFCDYIDYKEGKIIRYIKVRRLLSSDGWSTYEYNQNGLFVPLTEYISLTGYGNSMCTHFKHKGTSWSYGDVDDFSDHPSSNRKYFVTDFENMDQWKNWIDSNEVMFNYVLLEHTEEKIELPQIYLNENHSTVSIETKIEPSKFELEYYN